MQKVVGSSPIIRSNESPARRGFLFSVVTSVSRFIPHPSHSGIFRPAENMRFQLDCRLPSGALVEVAVAPQDERPAVRVAHPLGDHLDVAAGGDHQRRAGVAEVVERELGDAGVAGGRLEDPAVEVVGVERRRLRARRRGSPRRVAIGRAAARGGARVRAGRRRPSVGRRASSSSRARRPGAERRRRSSRSRSRRRRRGARGSRCGGASSGSRSARCGGSAPASTTRAPRPLPR